jgi:hypothetical protein
MYIILRGANRLRAGREMAACAARAGRVPGARWPRARRELAAYPAALRGTPPD